MDMAPSPVRDVDSRRGLDEAECKGEEGTPGKIRRFSKKGSYSQGRERRKFHEEMRFCATPGKYLESCSFEDYFPTPEIVTYVG